MPLDIEIVTPRTIAWKGVAESIQAPGELGEFGVLPGHIPFLTTLQPGVVSVYTSGGVQRYQVGEGFAEAGPERVVILTESCEPI